MGPLTSASDHTWCQYVAQQAAGHKGNSFRRFKLDTAAGQQEAMLCARAACASDSDAWLTCTIVTRLCWPDLPNDPLPLPPSIRAVFDVYNDHYHAAKDPRKLLWR